MSATAGDGDRDFEQLIARGLASTSSTGKDCPSPDVLAAWLDRTLSPAETSSLQAHLADCRRCQEIAAVTAQSEPADVTSGPQVEAAAGRAWFWHWRWAVPLATAAIVIVVVGNRTTLAPGEVEQVARQASPPSRAAVPSQAYQASPLPPPQAESPRMTKREVPPPPPTTGFARDRADDEVAALAVPSPTSQPLADGATAGAAEGRTEQRLAAPRAAAPAAPPPVAILSESAATPTELEGKWPMTAEKGRAFLADTASRKSAAAERELVLLSAPGSPVAWRFGDGGVVERTPDGRMWVSQSSGVTSSLLAGWAVSSRICWIVGRDGVVLRTVNGLTWNRVPFPSSAHLVAVFAGSAEAASVRTADGREFVTTDGGATWQPR